MPLPPELESFASFVRGPAEIALAKGLAYDRATGLALVKALATEKQRSHLEALGEVASDKEVKKAARAAAYKLKSAGVAGGVQREAAIDLSVKVEVHQVAAATAPGFDGRLWLVCSSLPGAGGGEIDLREARGQRIEPIAELSIGRVRRFQQELVAERIVQPPILVSLDLAARLVGYAHQALTLAKKPMPPTFDHFRGWRDRAIALGADPEAASARNALGPTPRPLPDGAIDMVAAHPLLSFLAAPPSAFDVIDKEFRELLHGHEPIDKADFVSTGRSLVEAAAKAWAAAPSGKEVAASWLEATADVLMANGDGEEARLTLTLADDLRAWDGTDPLAHPLVERAFRGAVDLEAAWMHREAHVRGDAHHGE